MILRVSLVLALWREPAQPVNPRAVAELVATAETLRAQGRFIEAFDALERAHAMDPRPDYLYALAVVAREASDCPRAVSLLRQFLASNPTDEDETAAREELRLCGATAGPSVPSSSIERSPAVSVGPRTSDRARFNAKPDAPSRQPLPHAWYRDPAGGSLLGIGLALVGTARRSVGRGHRDEFAGACPRRWRLSVACRAWAGSRAGGYRPHVRRCCAVGGRDRSLRRRASCRPQGQGLDRVHSGSTMEPGAVNQARTRQVCFSSVRVVVIVVTAATILMVACVRPGTYPCETDRQCRDGDVRGACEISGFCSYPDTECPSGKSYDGLAGSGLAEQCVPPSDCSDRDGDGHWVGMDCLRPDCDDDNPTNWDACKYISPDGDDTNPGTITAPWRTFRHATARAQLAAGDSLVLLDGDYHPTTTGVLDVACPSAANNGTSDAPISVRALHERAAVIDDAGMGPAVRLTGCFYWKLTGLAARSRDSASPTSVFEFDQVSQVYGRRLLGWRPGGPDADVFSIREASNVTLEESEAYQLQDGNTGFYVYISNNVMLRRCYVRGGTGFMLSRVGDCIVENCIAETTSVGFRLFNGTYDTRVLGSMVTGGFRGLSVEMSTPQFPTRGVVVEHLVVIGSATASIFLSGAVDTRIVRSTLVSGRGRGVLADSPEATLCPMLDGLSCSFHIASALVMDHGGEEVWTAPDYAQALVEHGNLYDDVQPLVTPVEDIEDEAGIVRSCVSQPADEVGSGIGQCLVVVPESAGLAGKGSAGDDIGAEILFRYESGVLTQTPLWSPEFPCGAMVAGVNDDPTQACSGLAARFNVGQNGCMLPDGYLD